MSHESPPLGREPSTPYPLQNRSHSPHSHLPPLNTSVSLTFILPRKLLERVCEAHPCPSHYSYTLPPPFADDPRPFEAELKKREAALGANHPDVAESCGNLAILYNQKGQTGGVCVWGGGVANRGAWEQVGEEEGGVDKGAA